MRSLSTSSNMAIVHKHFIFLQLLFMFLISLDYNNGLVEGSRDHFRRRDIIDNGRYRNHTHIRKRQSKSNRTHQRGQQELYPIIVRAQTGSRAILNCNLGDIEMVENMTVRWIKTLNDSVNLLTINDRVITDDKRFLPLFRNEKVWSLHIRYTQNADEGLYRCQICANSTASIYFKLKLVEAHAKIIGPPVKDVKKTGSPLRLSCVLQNSIEAPVYIFWYHGDRMINYDLGDGASVRQGRQGSELIFPRANTNHSGNYSCVPSNARLASVMVIVTDKSATEIKGKNGSGKNSHTRRYHFVNMLVLVSTFYLYR